METTLRLRIDWSELDYFGHVNNVSFFKYIQAARVNFWEHIGIYKTHQETNIGPMLASTGCNFKSPLFYPGEVTIKTQCTYVNNSSFGFDHQLFNHANLLVAEAKDVMVMFDFNLNRKVNFPLDLKASLGF